MTELCADRLPNPKDWDWWDPCDREQGHGGPHIYPLVSSKSVAAPAESPTSEPSSVPVRVADDSTTQKENEHG